MSAASWSWEEEGGDTFAAGPGAGGRDVENLLWAAFLLTCHWVCLWNAGLKVDSGHLEADAQVCEKKIGMS